MGSRIFVALEFPKGSLEIKAASEKWSKRERTF
jgi:hypothetical protein